MDLEKAREYYLRALDCKSSNFPCLMDYLKLVKDTGTYDEILKVVDKFSRSSRDRDAYIVKMLIERGCIIWLHSLDPSFESREKACQSWLQVFLKYNDFKKDVYVSYRKPYFN